jgi:hypothetical protein
MLRIPHRVDNQFIDCDKVVSATHRPHFTPQKDYYFNVSGTINIYSEFQFLLTSIREVSSVGIVIGHGMDEKGSNPGRV